MSSTPSDGDNVESKRASGEQPAPSTAPARAEAPADRFRESLQGSGGDDDLNEEDVWSGGFSPKAMFGKWMLAGALTVILIIVTVLLPFLWWLWLGAIAAIWGGLWCYYLYRKFSLKYFLTTQRFIHQSGILKRVTDRIEVIDIDDVSFEQGLVERFVGVGSIKITSSDRSHPELWMRGIDRVSDIAGQIDDLRRKERRRRGVHIEAI
jgi:hypothetical protein